MRNSATQFVRAISSAQFVGAIRAQFGAIFLSDPVPSRSSLEGHYQLDLLAAEDVLPFWRSFPGRARRLMELQRNTQSLIAHASAARTGAAGTQTEGGAPEAAALLLWPSVRATQVRAAAAEISSLKSRLEASQGGTRLLLQWLLARMSPQQMDAASRLGLLDVIAMDGECNEDYEHSVLSGQGRENEAARVSIVFKRALVSRDGKRGHTLEGQGRRARARAARGGGEAEVNLSARDRDLGSRGGGRGAKAGRGGLRAKKGVPGGRGGGGRGGRARRSTARPKTDLRRR